MAPASKIQIINDVFNALIEVPDFNLSREQLDEALAKSNFQISKTSKTTSDSSSKKRMSAYRMFQKDHNKSTGFDKEQAKTRWEEIKVDKLLLSEYEDKANQWNIDNGFGSKEEAKNAKKSEKQIDQQSLKDEIQKLKLQLQNKTQSKSESDPEPEKDEPEKDEPESEPESEPEKDEPEKDEPEKDEPESEPESESEKDELEKDELEKDELEKDEPEKDEPEKDEPEPDSESESESEDELEPEPEVIKPKYEGKNSHTPLNNYKEWKKNQLNTNKINSADLKKFQSEDNYDKNKYNDSLPWFEFIKNNFTIE